MSPELAGVVDGVGRGGDAGGVPQTVALELGVAGGFGVNQRQAANEAPARVDFAGHVQLDAARAGRAGGAPFGQARVLVELRDEHAFLADVKKRQRAGQAARAFVFGAHFPGLAAFGLDAGVNQPAGVRGDGGDGFERLAVAGVERDGGRELVDHAQAGQPFAVAGVGVELEGAAPARALRPVQVARAGGDDPLAVQVDGVLKEKRVVVQQVALVAVASHNGRARPHAAIHGVEVAESVVHAAANHVGAVNLAVFGVHAELHVVLHAAQPGAAVDVGGAVAVGAERAPGAVGAAAQQAGGGVDAQQAQLVGVIRFAVVAQAHVARPAGRDAVIQRELRQVALALHLVERLVQAARGGNVQRLVRARIQRGATVKRHVVVTEFVPEHGLRVAPVPGQRRGQQHVAPLAEVAPVIFIRVVGHQAPGQAAVGHGAGGIQQQPRAVAAAPVAGAAHAQGRARLHLGLFAHHVHHPARIHDAVEHGRRPFEHHHAFGGGVHATALHQRHAVVHDGAVAVAAKAALEDGVLRARQRVALRDAADVHQRIVHVARALVAQHLGGDGVGHLRHFQRGGQRAQRGRIGHGLIAAFMLHRHRRGAPHHRDSAQRAGAAAARCVASGDLLVRVVTLKRGSVKSSRSRLHISQRGQQNNGRANAAQRETKQME